MPSFDDPFDLDYYHYRLPGKRDWRQCIRQRGLAAIDVTPDMRACRTFLGLPTELLDMIIIYIATKRDLAALCSTSQRLFATCTPVLYRKLHFVIKTAINTSLQKMLTRENPGLQRIREIVISLDWTNSYCGPAYQWMEVFINAIPKDLLRRFR